jgi:hypothetical protein
MSTHGSRSRRWVARISAAALLVGTTTAVSFSAVSTASADPVTGAVSTSVNTEADGPIEDLCQNGNADNNCNIYNDKQYVWLSGLPDATGVNDGTYFFAVLVPGGQGANSDANPNDGTAKNLSDTVLAPHEAGYVNGAPDGSAAPSGDAYTDRTFTITNGVISYSGTTHQFANDKIRLFPYDDTTNPGGEYILAVCRVPAPAAEGEDAPEYLPGVDPASCKYDAFKVKVEDDNPPTLADNLQITKDAAGAYTTTYTWSVTKSLYDESQAEIETSSSSVTLDYDIDVQKSAGTTSGITVTGTITVTNPNVDDVSGVTVTDTLSDGTVCTVTDGTSVTVGTGETTFAYTCSLAALPTDEPLINTASVSWAKQTLEDGELEAGSADFSFGNEDFDGDGEIDLIAFTETTVDDCISVVDYFDGDLVGESLGTTCQSTSYAPSKTLDTEAGTCIDVPNTVKIFTADDVKLDEDTVSSEICAGADLTVIKTATPTFTRTYGWGITKAVDKTIVRQVGGSATFNYTVTASQTGVTDSAWAVTGTITVSNPNDWQAVPLLSVSDSLSSGESCDVTIDLSPIAANGTRAGTYSCPPLASGASGVNTVTVGWDAVAASTPSGSATNTADYAFTTPTTKVNETINVTDSYAGALGTVTANDSAPFASQAFTYSRTVPVPANTCQDYPNTATIVETGATASQSVRVCGAVTGGLTMGFWQNKNGQNIIGRANQPDLTTFLTTYNPFKDQPASGKSWKEYTTAVIKAANASGASMNAMLKAQMLATALDVYFSSPASGNPIKAPASLGGVNVDLTTVCKNIATCTVFENTSAAFGGASSLTVAELLAYSNADGSAAGNGNPVSSTGGLDWYVQNKPRQELAKDTFDAINNAVAFAAP